VRTKESLTTRLEGTIPFM
jgi:serine/threonine-protein kinase SRPK3